MTTVLQMIPDGYFQNKDLERLLIELNKIAEHKDVMRTDEAAAFLSVSVSTLNVMCRKGLPYHRLAGFGGKLFLRSELIDFIKKH